jgi:hypothetical protein
MKNIKANLKIILKANETVVAESNEPLLWQKVLGSINNALEIKTGEQ